MEEVVKKDLLAVLRETVAVLEHKDPNSAELTEISNHTIHNASIYQDENSISIAILVYSLSKIIARVKGEVDFSKIKNLLELAVEYLEDDNTEDYQDFIREVFSIISNIDIKFKLYIQDVIKQASIKKGSRIYEHGISASKTAEILGISVWDFYKYLGETNINEANDISNVRERLKFTRELLS